MRSKRPILSTRGEAGHCATSLKAEGRSPWAAGAGGLKSEGKQGRHFSKSDTSFHRQRVEKRVEIRMRASRTKARIVANAVDRQIGTVGARQIDGKLRSKNLGIDLNTSSSLFSVKVCNLNLSHFTICCHASKDNVLQSCPSTSFCNKLLKSNTLNAFVCSARSAHSFPTVDKS